MLNNEVVTIIGLSYFHRFFHYCFSVCLLDL
jgi:hypothetical protein